MLEVLVRMPDDPPAADGALCDQEIGPLPDLG